MQIYLLYSLTMHKIITIYTTKNIKMPFWTTCFQTYALSVCEPT